MNTLIYGAGPIGRWLALKLAQAGRDVTLLARGTSLDDLRRDGVVLVDGLTGERLAARVKLVDRLNPDDTYDLVVVAMAKASRLDVCPALARCPGLHNILFLGNDVSGFRRYLDHLPADKVLLGFPSAGGGWDGDQLVIVDRDKPRGRGQLFIGELDGRTRGRTRQIKALFESAGLEVNVEPNIDGWLKYHFAFIAPTAGVTFMKGGDMRSVATDSEAIHRYCRACREAGDVLRAAGYHKRQPAIFNLYYWLPRWLEPKAFGKLFGSSSSQIRFGLHARTVGPELLEMASEFAELKASAGVQTAELDALLAHVPRPKDLRSEVA